ncbi:MAG TPA: ADOP family duplicated permease [Vicinamibacterales bacterium]|nr:ADOP family duplicated permease [Vicinamibacterales bacterium]
MTLERLWLDIRMAVRLWARTPGFSAVAIATIGLGIGASTALVAQVKAVFWTPLPVASPQDLRFVAWTSPRHPYVLGPNVMAGPTIDGATTYGTVSYPAYLAMRDEATAFSDIACWADLGEARPVILGELGFGTVQFVSGNYFRTLGVAAAIGRTLQPDDHAVPAWSPVAMISHRFWLRTFGGATDVTSRTLRLNGRAFAIVGVMPAGFFGLDPSVSPDIVVPNGAVEVAAATQNPLQNRGLWNPCRIVARLAPGRTDEEARLDLERILAASIAAAPPTEPYDPPRVRLVPAGYGQSTLRDGTATPLVVLLTVVGGLLLASCANIAGLLLARGTARSREIATRMALGASRARVVRQLITESLVLSLVGGALGLMLAYVLSGAGAALLSQFMPTLFGADRAIDVASRIDARLLVFGAVLAVSVGLLFGAVPALRATRLDLIAVIKGNARSGLPRFGLTGAQAMVAAQTALAIGLLVGAGLFMRTLDNLRATDLGFQADGLLYANIEPRSGGLPPEQRRQFFEDAVARLRALPGVVSAAASGTAPMGGETSVGVGNFQIPICSTAYPRAAAPELVTLASISPGYFETLGISILEGRDLEPADTARFAAAFMGPRPVVVNEAFAQRYFPGRSAIGQEAGSGRDCATVTPNFTVAGVVRDNRTDARAAASPGMFFPLGGFQGPVTLLVRTAGDPAQMITIVRRAMTELNANTPTFSEATLSSLVERRLRRERLLSSLLAVFAGVTLFICCLGIYGMLAYAVERRRQEISVRMAIGAQASDVIGLMVKESLVPVACGLVAGAMLTAAANRWLAQILYGVASYDPLTLAGASAVFIVIAAAAAALPSRAATRVNPVLALRQ